MNILGINNFFEHPAIALVRDGHLAFAIEDERFTRVKHGKGSTPYRTYIPWAGIHAALAAENLTFADIDEVAFSYSRREHLKALWGCLTGRRLSTLSEELHAYRSAANMWPAMLRGHEMPQRYAARINLDDVRKTAHREWDHHLSHAASSFYCSGFDQALVVVADGSGESACTSFYRGDGKVLRKVADMRLPHSLGFFYSFMTKHLGFEPFADEYKVMGLAAYGKDAYRTEMGKLVHCLPRGRYEVNMQLLTHLAELIGPPRAHGAAMSQQHRDLAKSAQVRLEEVLEHIVGHFMRVTKSDSLCLAGGIFLNILANARLVALPEVKRFFVQPSSHDAGTAIGAASLSSIARGGQAQISYTSMFLGSQHSEDSIEAALRLAGVRYQRLDAASEVDTIADLLAAENILAVFRGRMEFGPRALGHRSLIASPKSTRTRLKLNELKVREQFRPLAPLVASEDFERFFEGHPSRYMMLTVTVREDVRDLIPAVVHHDGSARSQVVYKEHDATLHALLKAYEARTGVPVLINTSLNVRGRPIDESPHDALASFLTSGIDYLWMGNFLVERGVSAAEPRS